MNSFGEYTHHRTSPTAAKDRTTRIMPIAQTTVDVYAHVREDAQRQAVERAAK